MSPTSQRTLLDKLRCPMNMGEQIESEKELARLQALSAGPADVTPDEQRRINLWVAVRLMAEGSDWKRDQGETLTAWVQRKLRASSEAGADDAKDAARWRWLRHQHTADVVNQWFIYGAHAQDSSELDAEIDAAMSAATKESSK